MQLNVVENEPRKKPTVPASNVDSALVRMGTTRRHQGAIVAPARAFCQRTHTANALTDTESTTHTRKIEEGQLQPNAEPSGDDGKIF